jgi:hypothetical protein
MLPDVATAVRKNDVTCRAQVAPAQLVNFNALRLGKVIDVQFPIWRSQARDGGRAPRMTKALEA